MTANAEHLTRDIRNSSVVLMPSRTESFGLAWDEAVAAILVRLGL